jgi:indole-3-glycerol phosphate synthase
MPASLDQIVAATRRKVAGTLRSANLRELENQAEQHAPRGFRQALEKHRAPAVIAELKKASPSRGLIRADFNPADLAVELETAGAAALSVLTDAEFFQGSLQNLQKASAATKIPCLRKDFMVDEFQLLEARASRADAVLLIVAALAQSELETLAKKAKHYSLDVLCEVHDEKELERAVTAGCDLIGVNSRDLRTFAVDLNTAFRLANLIPKNVLSVAESGIHNGKDITRLKAAGYRAFLIGESLMKEASPGRALQALLTESELRAGN